MYPILFRIGSFTVTSYGLMLVLAFVGAGLVVAKEFKRRGWRTVDANDIALAAMVGGVVGSKVWWALANWDLLMINPGATILSRGGFTFYGGLFGGILTVGLILLWKKYPLGEALNACTPALPVGYMLGRVGCFLVGDDYGYPTDVPWGVAFPEGSPPTAQPVHPTQIYEILMTLPIFLLLWSQRKKDLPGAFLFWELMVLAGIERFVVEFWRVNRVIAMGLTAAQLVSIGLVVIGIVGLLWVTRRPAEETAPTPV